MNFKEKHRKKKACTESDNLKINLKRKTVRRDKCWALTGWLQKTKKNKKPELGAEISLHFRDLQYSTKRVRPSRSTSAIRARATTLIDLGQDRLPCRFV